MMQTFDYTFEKESFYSIYNDAKGIYANRKLIKRKKPMKKSYTKYIHSSMSRAIPLLFISVLNLFFVNEPLTWYRMLFSACCICWAILIFCSGIYTLRRFKTDYLTLIETGRKGKIIMDDTGIRDIHESGYQKSVPWKYLDMCVFTNDICVVASFDVMIFFPNGKDSQQTIQALCKQYGQEDTLYNI